jgi:membrane protein YdbS with pleckstrin-like domain
VPDASSSPRPDPARRLAAQARTLWTLGALGWALPLVLVVPAVVGAIDGVPDAVKALTIYALLAAGGVGVLVVPQLRWRRWRWDVRDEEVDLRHGAFSEIRTIVPMARVQHVDVRRTFLAQRLGTADLVVHTAAGQTRIPMLPEASAVEVRDRIADLARTPDEL